MPTVGIKELKNKLSEYLNQVKDGQKLAVTDRGKIVAIISPPADSTISDDVAALLRAGIGKWSGKKPEGSTVPFKNTGDKLSDIVMNERR